MSYFNRNIYINIDYQPDVNLGWMMLYSFLFHILLLLAVLALSTLTFGKGRYIPTIYEVKLVSLSTQPLAAVTQLEHKIKTPSAPKLTTPPPVVENRLEPAIILPEKVQDKKRVSTKKITQKRALEKVKRPPPKKKKIVAEKIAPPKREVSPPVKKKSKPPSDTSKKLKEIQKRLLAAAPAKPEKQAKPSAKDEDIRIIGGASGGSLLGRAHFGAVATLRMKMYLNRVRERIESALVWPSTLETENDWIARVSIRITRDGKIEKYQIEEKSGNSFFDDAVLRAINKANPLPPLPDTYRENVLEILCAFHSEKGH